MIVQNGAFESCYRLCIDASELGESAGRPINRSKSCSLLWQKASWIGGNCRKHETFRYDETRRANNWCFLQLLVRSWKAFANKNQTLCQVSWSNERSKALQVSPELQFKEKDKVGLDLTFEDCWLESQIVLSTSRFVSTLVVSTTLLVWIFQIIFHQWIITCHSAENFCQRLLWEHQSD